MLNWENKILTLHHTDAIKKIIPHNMTSIFCNDLFWNLISTVFIANPKHIKRQNQWINEFSLLNLFMVLFMDEKRRNKNSLD